MRWVLLAVLIGICCLIIVTGGVVISRLDAIKERVDMPAEKSDVPGAQVAIAIVNASNGSLEGAHGTS